MARCNTATEQQVTFWWGGGRLPRCVVGGGIDVGQGNHGGASATGWFVRWGVNHVYRQSCTGCGIYYFRVLTSFHGGLSG